MNPELKDVWVLWLGPEKKLSLQGEGFSALLHLKKENKQPIRIPGIMWPAFKKKISDALMTKQAIVIEEEDFKKREKLLDEELSKIPAPEIKSIQKQKSGIIFKRHKEI